MTLLRNTLREIGGVPLDEHECLLVTDAYHRGWDLVGATHLDAGKPVYF